MNQRKGRNPEGKGQDEAIKASPEADVGHGEPVQDAPAPDAEFHADAEATAEESGTDFPGHDESVESGDAAQDWAQGVADMLRKAVVTGLGAAIMTEEGVRGALRELNLPETARGAIGTAIDQAGRGRDELRRIVGDEAKRLADTPALRREITRSLCELAIEMTVRIQLNPSGGGPKITFSHPRICRKPQAQDKERNDGSEGDADKARDGEA